MTLSKMVNILNTLKNKETFFGPQGFKIVANQQEFNKAQQGFSVDKKGNCLSETHSTKKGDTQAWLPTWSVIGKDIELGDAYFVDFSDEQLPVYLAIAAKQNKQWHTTLVASSLTGFIECLILMQAFTGQTETMFVPNSDAIFDLEKLERFGIQLTEIARTTDFWKNMFIGYVQWLQDEYI